MRNRASKRLLYISTLLLLSSCLPDSKYKDTPRDNFIALWTLIDEKYCFLDYKSEQIGLDWNGVKERYSKRISNDMDDMALFEVLSEMLAELRDGHVNLYALHNISRYWSWKTDYPDNFDRRVINRYLGNDYYIGGGLEYTILDDNIGYIYIGSFSDGVGEFSIAMALQQLAMCNGLILDVRSNGGGNVSSAATLASFFTDKRTLVGYIMHKRGAGHTDFSTPEPRYIEPNTYYNRWHKPVVVLANRGSYSATNTFISDMKHFDGVVIMGDTTGGGSGMPISSELPNGWSVRYSAVPKLNAQKQHIEFGVAPHVEVAMDDSVAYFKGVDTIIEEARRYINGNMVGF